MRFDEDSLTFKSRDILNRSTGRIFSSGQKERDTKIRGTGYVSSSAASRSSGKNTATITTIV